MKLMRLRHVATLSNSNVDKLTDADEVPVRLCNYVDVYKNDKINNALEFMRASATPSEIKRFGLKVGDVIITKDSEDASDIGVPAYVSETAPDLVCGYHLTLLRSVPDVMRGDFLFWSLNSKLAREQMSNAANGITRFGLTLSGMKSVAVPTPDLDTQKTIADFLDRETTRIDQLIEKKEQSVDLLLQRYASQRDAMLAEGRDTRLKFVSNYITSGSRDWGGLYADDGELFIRIGNISGSSIDVDLSSRTYVQLGERTEGLRTRLLPDDLLVSITANLGSVAVVGPEAAGAYINQHVALVRLTKTKAVPRYVAYSLQTKRAQEQFDLRGYGGTKQGLSLVDVGEIAISLPDLDVQLRTSNVLDQAYSKVATTMSKVRTSVDRLREFRSALITAAVTGQIDVTTWGKQGSTDRRLDQIEEEMSV